MTTPIAAMRNLGPKMARMLAGIGIHDAAALRAIGAAEAFARLRATTDHRVSLNALYAMHAALLGCDWRALDAATKAMLRARVAPSSTAPAPTAPASAPARPAPAARRRP